MKSFGLRKGLEDVSQELKGIKNILSAMWYSKYQTGETMKLHPDAFADEYISTEECAQRLGISDQTIRNWIARGKKDKSKGWTEGLHYVNINPETKGRPVIRIPWNELVRSFIKNPNIELLDLNPSPLYQPHKKLDI